MIALMAVGATACMPPAPPEQPRRLVEPGEFYWAQLECVAGARLAVTTPQAQENGSLPNQAGQWMSMADVQQDFRSQSAEYMEDQRLSAMQQQYVEDCIRFKGYGWYLDRMRDVQDWLRYLP
jgi:hypothetical protein